MPFTLKGSGSFRFADLAAELALENVMLIGLRRAGVQNINPGPDYELADGDDLFIISSARPRTVERTAPNS